MKNLTLGKKIAYGFGVLILISMILGGMAVIVMHISSNSAQILAKEYAAELNIISNLQTDMGQAQLAMRTFAFTGDESFYNQAVKKLQEARESVIEAKKLAENSPHLPKLRAEIGKYAEALSNYEGKVEETGKIQREIKTNTEALYRAGAQFSTNITAFFDSQFGKLQEEVDSKTVAPEALSERMMKVALAAKTRNEGNQARIAASHALINRDPEDAAKALPRFEEIARLTAQIAPMIHQPANMEQLSKVRESANDYRNAVTRLGELMRANAKVMTERSAFAKQMDDTTGEFYDNALHATIDTANLSATSLVVAKSIMVAGLLVAIVVGVALSTLITRSITVPVHKLIDRLSAGSDQTTAAAGQVSAASQALAEGASEQAASLEETSSSLEEMASMTAHNAENAANAKTLATEARTAADDGTGEMVKMNAAMEAIKKSSDDISKIIKTIDEIAFQTNILALNAAVEAARAGEAGMGFAVVADEVRALAHRSAVAAKETTDKIQDAIAKSAQGVEISTVVTEKLKEVVAKAHQVDTLVAEIATASKEQSTGITQVNTAVSQMDKVTQTNAASAEETAAAAEELNAQSEELRNAVRELQEMVGGREDDIVAGLKPLRQLITAHAVMGTKKAAAASISTSSIESKRDRAPMPAAPAARASASTLVTSHREHVPDGERAIRNKSLIPMEDDFKDM